MIWIQREDRPDTPFVDIRITGGDPIEWIDPGMLDDITAGRGMEFATRAGDVLTLVDSTGRKLIYRLGPFVPAEGAYRMEWPD